MVIWEFIRKTLSNNQKVSLMVVVESKGSSPGRPGFKMAVSSDGEMSGSIGGGMMEYNMVELAKKQFIVANGIFIKHQNHCSDSKSDRSGMICSGSQTIAFYPLDKGYLPIIESINTASEGKLIFNESGINFDRGIHPFKEINVEIRDDNKWLITEPVGYNKFLYVFGAGHVSVAVSLLFKELGFHITVFDDRDKHLTTFKHNSFANSKKIIDYNKSADYIPEGDNIYVVIMTFACKSDGKVLKHLVDKKVKYLGMMGSQEKVDTVFKKLEGKGVSKKKLSFIDSPIGLPINSQTPMEIAVSLAAKVISVKNSN